jgi:hypothetical protein
MALFTEERLRNRARDQINKGNYGSIYDSYQARAKNIIVNALNEQKTYSGQTKNYDIFLSHSSNDAEIVSGLKLEIEDLGYSVYVDWIEDPLLNRKNVTKETALVLQERMKNCKSLIYAFSENATNSKWMPWELGYFDALKGTVAVLPISRTSKRSFVGSEYLGIYFYIQFDTIQGTDTPAIWVHETVSKYMIFDSWLKGSKPTQR